MRRVLSIIISISLILCSCILSNQEVYADENPINVLSTLNISLY